MIVSNDMLHDSRVDRHAEALGALGHDVTVICYASALNQVQFERKKHYDIMRIRSQRALIARKLFHTKTNDGITSRLQNAGRIASLVISARISLYFLMLRARVDVCYCNDLDTLDVGIVMKLVGRRVVYDSHELYVDMLPIGVRRRIYELFERAFVNFADVIITVNPNIASELRRRYNIKKRVHVVLNCPDVPTRQSVSQSFKEQVTVLYHGRLDEDRGLENLVAASKMFEADVRLVIRGEGKLEKRLRQLATGSANVHFELSVPLHRIVQAASEADIGIIPYVATNLNQLYCSPNKLFEYIQGGLALVTSNLPFLQKIVKENEIGDVFNALDPFDIARKVNSVSRRENLFSFRRNVFRIREHYSWAAEKRKLYAAFNELL